MRIYNDKHSEKSYGHYELYFVGDWIVSKKALHY